MSCQKLELLRVEMQRINAGLKLCDKKQLKIWSPGNLIDHIYTTYDKIAVACSFGKDSLVVLHMALNYDKHIPVLFANTGVEFPELLRYKNQLVEEWGLNLIEVKPHKTFWQCVEKYGWPKVRTTKTRVPKCCYYLKKAPLKEAYKLCGCKVVLDGMRAAESKMRFMAGVHKGQLFYSKLDKVWRAHPLMWVNRKAVETYLKEHNIPQNPIYDTGQLRTGCWPCTAFNKWTLLAHTHPKLYEILQKKRGQSLIEYFA